MENRMRRMLEEAMGVATEQEMIRDERTSIKADEVKNTPQAVVTLPNGDVIKASSVICIFTNNIEVNGEVKDESGMGSLVFGPWNGPDLAAAGIQAQHQIKEALLIYLRRS